jgi:hypothetical protein
MADSQTTNLALTKPQVGVSTTWATKTNENWDTLDALFPGGVLDSDNGGLPSQTGNDNSLLTTDGTDASWTSEVKVSVAGDLVATNAGFIGQDGSSNAVVAISGNTSSPAMSLASGKVIAWSSTTYAFDTKDVALSRNAAGILEINNGTPGTFRDIRYRRSCHTVVAVSYSATPTFNAASGSSFTITLTGNVTSSTLNNIVAGQTVTFKIVQDGTGGRSFVWPTNVLGGMTIDDTAAAINCQQFHCFDGTNLEAISLGSQR